MATLRGHNESLIKANQNLKKNNDAVVKANRDLYNAWKIYLNHSDGLNIVFREFIAKAVTKLKGKKLEIYELKHCIEILKTEAEESGAEDASGEKQGVDYLRRLWTLEHWRGSEKFLRSRRGVLTVD